MIFNHLRNWKISLKVSRVLKCFRSRVYSVSMFLARFLYCDAWILSDQYAQTRRFLEIFIFDMIFVQTTYHDVLFKYLQYCLREPWFEEFIFYIILARSTYDETWILCQEYIQPRICLYRCSFRMTIDHATFSKA